jgi:hypothetical protein
MKEEQMNRAAPHGSASGMLAPRSRRGRADVALVAPKLTKLVTTKIITLKPRPTDATSLERERLQRALLDAQGRPAITAAANALLGAGHPVPQSQEAFLQLLEHQDEARVCAAIAALEHILATEPVKRRPVLEQRLKRLEETADEAVTRAAATTLRRNLR